MPTIALKNKKITNGALLPVWEVFRRPNSDEDLSTLICLLFFSSFHVMKIDASGI